MNLGNASGYFLTAAALIGSVYTGVAFVDGRYVHNPDPTTTELRKEVLELVHKLEEKILIDRHNDIAERVALLESRYPDMHEAPESVVEEYQKKKVELMRLTLELKAPDHEH